ncbi:ADP-ribose pyrophosphatase, mitochondrial [Chelonus insularis]|uniref:ADP-ribose pyrophosphatase, mitochondrial n=1 Tax=Chelonus insularis TaxID=460826 RepID=UPI00158A94AA|nr:ADP-ribose pyrophosphatase, mitochondrial [Chelonus insularis]
MTGKTLLSSLLHYKCRQKFYSTTKIKRFVVPDELVPWEVEFPGYDPAYYTATDGKPWADKNIGDVGFQPKWNAQDGDINRQSLTKTYRITQDGYPLNPIGRTGIKGRGLLGRWGPNHAADPIVTRWKRENNGDKEIKMDPTTQKPVLQFIGIQRRDTREWAIPGGMVEGNEVISSTLKREFMEEALNLLEKQDKNPEEVKGFKKEVDKLFEKGEKIFQGYVDDPRNTDNSWMETRVFNFHDNDGSLLDKITLEAGDDAADVRWMDIDNKLNLYASHSKFLQLVAQKHDAHW